MTKALLILLFLIIGFGEIFLFNLQLYPPVLLDTIIFLICSLSLITIYSKKRIGILTPFIFLCYALPFIHIIPYIWFDFNLDSPLLMWGLRPRPYMDDKTVIELMSLIGTVGATGLALGIFFGMGNSDTKISLTTFAQRRTNFRTLPSAIYMLWLATAVILAWFIAPRETVFTLAYTQSDSISQNWNFSSLSVISITFFAYALSDAIIDSHARRSQIKKYSFLFALSYVVVWFELLRGSREFLPFVVAAILMYYGWGSSIDNRNKHQNKSNLNIFLIIMFGSVIFVISFIVGKLRFGLVGFTVADATKLLFELYDSGSIGFDNILSGTWSAVLLTPFSISVDYVNSVVPLKYGQTYLDLLLSLPPGFLTDLIGFQRPIDSLHGPAWEMTYGMGGTHAVVNPFTNFGIIGVFLFMAILGLLFTVLEKRYSKSITVVNLTFFEVVTAGSPKWLWYGEKYIINLLIVWWLLSFLYRLLISLRINRSVLVDRSHIGQDITG